MTRVREREAAGLDESRPTRGALEILYRDLRSGPGGLSSHRAADRLARYGPNELPRPHHDRWLRDLARQFTHPLALLLWLAAGLAIVAGTPALAWAILAVIVINAVVAFAQERQAARAVEALARYLPSTVRALRDGQVVSLPTAEVVVGDVLVVGEGDRICADARLIDGVVDVDMSALTGESAPVTRTAGDIDTADRLVEAPDAVFSGTTCTHGQAHALVFATGAHTELGRIASLSQRATGAESPLERQVRRTAWLIAAVAIGIGLVFLPLGLLAGLSLGDAAVFAVGLLVANVPEGLLPTITLALAVGVRVLARDGVLVKRLSAVETLGSTTVICTDKTGTLTANAMRVVGVWSPGDAAPQLSMDHDEETSPFAWSPAPSLAAALADCNALDTAADPMEVAIERWAGDCGVAAARRVAIFAFDPERKRMSVVTERDGALAVQVKGAVETVLPRCARELGDGPEQELSDDGRAAVLETADSFAARGLRVLAVAGRSVDAVPGTVDIAEEGLCLFGLVAFLDPPRPEVGPAVAACHQAGIRVHVVTGDNGRTATEVARQVGIRAERTITGTELDDMSDVELDRLLRGYGEIVFARSTPESKLRIAESLAAQGEVVAMTGDGVNDAPALHRADIGVAMGRSGTDVAREAATMVLTDDNFASIATAVREGRRVYENLRKFVLYIFAHAVPEVIPFAVFALSAGRIPLPLTVLAILCIDLGTETFPALALAREPAEPDVMDRPPRAHSEHLINRRLLTRAWLVMGTVSAALAMGLFLAVLSRAGWHPGADVGSHTALHHAYLQATTITFAVIVACQVGTAVAARTERASLWTVGLFSNPLLLAGIAFELFFAAAVIYLPLAHHVLATAAPPVWAMACLPLCSALVWSVDEGYRFLDRRRAIPA